MSLWVGSVRNFGSVKSDHCPTLPWRSLWSWFFMPMMMMTMTLIVTFSKQINKSYAAHNVSDGRHWTCHRIWGAILSLAVTLAPHPITISKNPGFLALYLPKRNEFRFFSFNKHKIIYIFFIFGCCLLPEKFSFCPKNNGFARVCAACSPPQPPGSYAYDPITIMIIGVIVFTWLFIVCLMHMCERTGAFTAL